MTTIRDDQPVLDLIQLRSFLAVTGQLSFSAAARRLGISQSAVSQHISRLERSTGDRLLVRDTHTVALTPAGETLAGIARSMLDLNDQAVRFLGVDRPRGLVRFGVSEDFALSRLPELLRSLRRDHPGIDLELTVGLSRTLHRRLRARELDVVLAKQSPDQLSDPGSAELMFSDRIVWVGAPGVRVQRREPVPLIVYPPPSLTRDRAVEALDDAARSHHTVCTSGSLSGLRAAALAGLGVMPFARSLIPEGLTEVRSRDLPPLGGTDFVLSSRRRNPPAATRAVIDSVLAHQRDLQR